MGLLKWFSNMFSKNDGRRALTADDAREAAKHGVYYTRDGFNNLQPEDFEDVDTKRVELEAQKAEIEQSGGWTGPVSRALNRTKSTSEISAEIARRQDQGKPTQQLEDELNSRG